MAIYVIGDLHGCDLSFKALLKKIEFKPNSDKIYLVGDLVNRGPRSVDVLKRILDHDGAILPVLGNHDLTLLGIYEGFIPASQKYSVLEEIIASKHSEKIINYLRYLPLLQQIKTEDKSILVVHAGIHPDWSVEEAFAYNAEIQSILQDKTGVYETFLKTMMGNTSSIEKTSNSFERIRFLINVFTRMRFLFPNGELDFKHKDGLKHSDKHSLIPWFKFSPAKTRESHIIYGHWAALGTYQYLNTLCIDSGCAWGEYLTAVRVDTPRYQFFKVKNHD